MNGAKNGFGVQASGSSRANPARRAAACADPSAAPAAPGPGAVHGQDLGGHFRHEFRGLLDRADPALRAARPVPASVFASGAEPASRPRMRAGRCARPDKIN